VRENEKGRAEAVEGTTAILVAEIHKFLTSRTYSAFSPAIADLRRRFDEIRESTLDAHSGARSDPREIELAHELTKRLLDAALEQMKAGARSVSSEEALELEYRRFLENL
jgi:glutamyl-tRNA reductase